MDSNSARRPTTAALLGARPRFALPFTICPVPGGVRLFAGEDCRYTLTAPGAESWLAAFLARIDGRTTVLDAIAPLDSAARASAQGVVERLYGERLLVDGTVGASHRASRYSIRAAGTGLLTARLMDEAGAPALRVFCQDRLDYRALLQVNADGLRGADPWIWASLGPRQRAFVSPVFLPDAGPCAACLLSHFRRRSPAPEFYDELLAPERWLASAPADFPAPGIEIVAQLVRWKAASLATPSPPAATFRLHVVEAQTLEATAHDVFPDDQCAECGPRRP